MLASAGWGMRRLWRGLEPLYIIAALALVALIVGLAAFMLPLW